MTNFLNLRSAPSGAEFVGTNQNDTVLWDATERKWFVGAAAGVSPSVPFAFNTASPLVLAALPAGAKVVRAAIVISTPFDDAAATLSLGTPGSPALVLGPSDSRPSVAGQYETDLIATFAAADTLQLVISPGASTQGAGFVFFDII